MKILVQNGEVKEYGATACQDSFLKTFVKTIRRTLISEELNYTVHSNKQEKQSPCYRKKPRKQCDYFLPCIGIIKINNTCLTQTVRPTWGTAIFKISATPPSIPPPCMVRIAQMNGYIIS